MILTFLPPPPSTGRGEQPSGDGVWAVHLQGPSDHYSAGDARESPRWTAASLCGHHPGQRPGGRGQTRRQNPGHRNIPLPARKEGRVHLRHVQVSWNTTCPGAAELILLLLLLICHLLSNQNHHDRLPRETDEQGSVSVLLSGRRRQNQELQQDSLHGEARSGPGSLLVLSL